LVGINFCPESYEARSRDEPLHFAESISTTLCL
jgi:hypothetical protein